LQIVGGSQGYRRISRKVAGKTVANMHGFSKFLSVLEHLQL
jgi:hypothetical protein